MADALLDVTDLVKHFPVEGSRAVVQAVNGVSFGLAAGETLAIVGESGSGKTTIGRCVLGLIPPISGGIRFRGREMGRRWNVRSPALRGKMQLVFQEPGESLDPRMPIGRSVAEPLRLTKLDGAARERRVREVIERVNLPGDILDQYPTELSAGQQQRVAVARALVTGPELLVLDEPTSALDPTARAEIIDLPMRLQRELGTAYLFISHDLSAVHQVSHRIVVMYLGRILEQGAARAVFRRPRHPCSVGLLSSVLLPSPGLRRETTFVLEGEIPSPINRLSAGLALPVPDRPLHEGISGRRRSNARARGALLPPRRRSGAGTRDRHVRRVPAAGGADSLSRSPTSGTGRSAQWASLTEATRRSQAVDGGSAGRSPCCSQRKAPTSPFSIATRGRPAGRWPRFAISGARRWR